MAKMVKVGCRVPNGVMIRLSKPGFDDGTGSGVREMVHDGPGVRLNGPSSIDTGAGNTDRRDLPPGETEVDAEWWRKWAEQHRLNPLLTSGNVFLLAEDEENPTV